MGVILVIFGAIIFLVGWIMTLVAAFGTNVFWGLGCLLCYAIVGPIFVIMNWAEAKKAFLVQLVGLALAVTGFMIGMGG